MRAFISARQRKAKSNASAGTEWLSHSTMHYDYVDASLILTKLIPLNLQHVYVVGETISFTSLQLAKLNHRTSLFANSCLRGSSNPEVFR